MRHGIFPVLLVGVLLVLTAGAETVYVVQPGDSLFGIGRKNGVSPEEILRANGLSNPNKIRAGQRLFIPGKEKEPSLTPTPKAVLPPKEEPAPEEPKKPEVTEKVGRADYYLVRHGDTVSSVARKYEISVENIRSWNHVSGRPLRSGQRLRVSPPPAREEKVVKKNEEPAPEERREAPKYLFIDKIKQQLDAPRVDRRRWKYVVVHHSGTPSGNAKIFDYYHHSRGMENGLAYHFVIGNGKDSGDGEIEIGGRWMKQLQGGHLRSEELNEISLGICFVGDFNTSRPSKKQIAAAIELILYLRQRCGPLVFKGHREINPKPTDCPGKQFPLAAFHKLFD